MSVCLLGKRYCAGIQGKREMVCCHETNKRDAGSASGPVTVNFKFIPLEPERTNSVKVREEEEELEYIMNKRYGECIPATSRFLYRLVVLLSLGNSRAIHDNKN